jgi:hypothetical protein
MTEKTTELKPPNTPNTQKGAFDFSKRCAVKKLGDPP